MGQVLLPVGAVEGEVDDGVDYAEGEGEHVQGHVPRGEQRARGVYERTALVHLSFVVQFFLLTNSKEDSGRKDADDVGGGDGEECDCGPVLTLLTTLFSQDDALQDGLEGDELLLSTLISKS